MEEHSIKCVCVGDGAVGKTCMLISYSKNEFPSGYVPTIFDNYAVTITIKETPYHLCLFDTAGQEDYDRLRLLTYPKTDIFLVCFAVNSQDSLHNVVENWVPEIKEYSPGVPFILVGTKGDLRDEPSENSKKFVSSAEATRMAKRLGAVQYAECSAKTQRGLRDVFNTALITVLQPPKQRTGLNALCCFRH